MKRNFQFIMIATLLFIACDKLGLNNSDNSSECNELTLRKVQQRFGVYPYGLSNEVQFGVYYYDDDCDIITYEFYLGFPGQEKRTIYADYSYQKNRLSRVEEYTYRDARYVKTQIEEYEYDDNGLLSVVRYHTFSDRDSSWSDSVQEFCYNEHDLLIQMIIPGVSMCFYSYDSTGNAWKEELYPLFEVEYEPPLTKTYTYDTKKNPFYRHDTRPLLPMGNGHTAVWLSPNNIVGWESYSPETGEVVSKGSIDYKYNSEEYPLEAFETVVSPLTDPQPNTTLWFTEYEYLR